jgi:Crp-like helix-turn-helix domain
MRSRRAHRRTDDPIASLSSPCPLVRGLSSIIGIPRDAGVDAAIALHFPQETLAQLIGSTRRRVNQILHDWETAELITQRYGRIAGGSKQAREVVELAAQLGGRVIEVVNRRHWQPVDIGLGSFVVISRRLTEVG